MPRPFSVLFLGTGNSARSIMAESMLDALGGGRFRAFSAGSHPTGRVNPLAIELLARNGYPASGLRSKGWGEFARKDSPPIDFVIDVCDSAAAQARPVFPGRPVSAHWGISDPAAAEGDDDAKRAAFISALTTLRRRIQQFTALPFDSTDPRALGGALREIGSDA